MHKIYLLVKTIYNLVSIKKYYLGEYNIKCRIRLIQNVKNVKKSFVFLFAFCFIIPYFSYPVFSFNNDISEDEKIISAFIREIDIPPGSDYYIKFDSNNLTLISENISSYSAGLSEKIKNAIAKSPRWIQRELTRQFNAFDGEEYADLILDMNKKYVDEIAYTIASSPLGNVPPVDILRDDVKILYENDKWIKYADIIDYYDDHGDYYSTIRYKVIENEIVKQFEYPPDIYYGYVVHPEIVSKAEYIYGKFWRDYLFNHNDLGYPLLKEKLSEISYLWDCKSYSQYGNRLWSWSMDNHPTAVEAISYWIGKTVPHQAFGDRPWQPNVIAHEHNGWCGELKTLAVAAQCTALIPSVSANNVGEDHVWREFYERGWHHSDNWWSDSGGAIDKPDVYAYGWGKDMSSIYAINGDRSIYELTSTYIHPEDRKTICFQILDSNFQPVDGARVTVTVEGPKDMTGVKFQLLEIIENIWDIIPPILRGKILQMLYTKIKERIDEMPDSVDGSIHSIWNYTKMDGKCCFELGQNRSYIFIVQYGNLKDPFQLARFNKIRIQEKPVEWNYKIWFPFLTSNKDKLMEEDMPNGDISFKVSYNTESYQIQENLRGKHKIVYNRDGRIDFFILDENNFNKYCEGLNFKCYNYNSVSKDKVIVNAQDKDWYLVFRNNAYESNIVLNFNLTVEMPTSKERVDIVSPDTSIFDTPIFNIGDSVVINGIATDDIFLNINEVPFEIPIQNCKWDFEWDTSELVPGNYLIRAECGDAKDEMLIRLIDVFPPHIKIDTPFDNDIVEVDFLTIKGHASDNFGVERIEVSFDNCEWKVANGTNLWSIEWDISSIDIGDHIIFAQAFDRLGGVSLDKIHIVKNESGHNWGPKINSYYHQPNNPTNVSNIIIFSNITKESSFSIYRVILYLDDGNETKIEEMYRYGDNPAQDRHEEDPLYNMSNEPIFGRELGQFPTETNITFWIEAFDSANNKVVSSKKSFFINGISE